MRERTNLAAWFLDRHVQQGNGERTALLSNDGPVTYRSLAALSAQAGNALLSLGTARGDRVLLALGDSSEFVATWYGAQRHGLVTAEVYTFLQPKDYAYYVEYTGATVIVTDAQTLPRIRESLGGGEVSPRVLVCGATGDELREGEHPFDEVVAVQPAGLECAGTAIDDDAIWKFTTGSTGRPKACVHRMRSPFASHDAYAAGVLQLRGDDVVLPVPKLFFGYARDLAALFPFGVGAAGIVFPERSTPERIFELIAQHRPTVLVNVPTMMQAMLDHPLAGDADLSCLRLCTSAGEALPEPLHHRWLDRFGVEVLDGIGSSEAYHIYISNRPGRVRIGSMGEAVPGYVATVRDEAGNAVTDSETGRLWIEGPTAARMYWGHERATRDTFGESLVRSGDLVMRDGDGFFWYRGRADDMLKIGGIFVAPQEIEQCLSAHADIESCAVVGVERDGLTLSCAYVVLRGESRLDEAAVQQFVRDRLSPHKVPRTVVFVDHLPTTGSGKIDRGALRARFHETTAAPA